MWGISAALDHPSTKGSATKFSYERQKYIIILKVRYTFLNSEDFLIKKVGRNSFPKA